MDFLQEIVYNAVYGKVPINLQETIISLLRGVVLKTKHGQKLKPRYLIVSIANLFVNQFKTRNHRVWCIFTSADNRQCYYIVVASDTPKGPHWLFV